MFAPDTAAEGADGRCEDGWNDTTYDGFHDHTKVWSVIDSATGDGTRAVE